MTRVGARAESGFVMVGTFSVTSCRALRRLQSLIRSCRGCVLSRTRTRSISPRPAEINDPVRRRARKEETSRPVATVTDRRTATSQPPSIPGRTILNRADPLAAAGSVNIANLDTVSRLAWDRVVGIQ